MLHPSNTSAWQRLFPSATIERQGSEARLTYSPQSLSESPTGNARSMSWPRNCWRILAYTVFAVVAVIVIGYTTGFRGSSQLTVDNIILDQKTFAIAKDLLRKYNQTAILKKPEADYHDLFAGKRIPNVYHYIWCQPDEFQFKHYLSVRSVIEVAQPDLIVFHLTNEPEEDMLGYNDWWKRLKTETQNLVIHLINETNCSSPQSNISRTSIFKNHVATQGGIFISTQPSAIILATALPLKHGRIFGFSPRNLPSIVTLKPSKKYNFKLMSKKNCQLSSKFKGKSVCTVVTDKSQLYPRDIWEMPNRFGKLTRSLAYGTEDALTPVPQPQTLVPMICHYLWLGGGEMNFLLYLSILSCLNVLKADAVLLHGELEPKGVLWKELLKQGGSKLHYVYRPQQPTMFGTPIKKLMAMSDVLRTDILLKYGGIYTDWDAIWVKPLDTEIRSYDAVVAPDWPDKLKPFPATLNLGVMLAKPGSLFVKHLQESMADYADGVGPLQWCFICLRAYKVLEKYPTTARLEPHLQVMSYLGKYHPVWQPGAGKDDFNGKFDWKTETYSVHWTFPTPRELRSKRGLKAVRNTTAAQIARFVLESSGIKS